MEAALAMANRVVDCPFPIVSTTATRDDVYALGSEMAEKVVAMGEGGRVVAHVMGEMTLCFCLVNLLKERGVECVASCTARKTVEENGVKTSVFLFEGFREY